MITKQRISEIIVEELHKILKSEDRTNLFESNLEESYDSYVHVSHYLEPNKSHAAFALDPNTSKIILGYDMEYSNMGEFVTFAKEIENQLIKLKLDPDDINYVSLYRLKKMNIDPMDEKNWSNGKLEESSHDEINKDYTHFLVDKETNMILNGWEYSGLDNGSIKDFLKADLKDMGIKPNEVKLYTKSQLKSKGIDPFDEENWELS